MRPLLLSLLLLTSSLLIAQNGAKAVAASALEAQAVACGNDYKPGISCHANYPTGCALKGGKVVLNFHPGYDAYLNYFKNQVPTVLPKSQGTLTRTDFVTKYRSAAKSKTKITKSNHRLVSSEMLALGEGQYFTVVGFLYYVKVASSGESSNCDIASDEPSDDYHIGIGFSASDAAGVRPDQPGGKGKAATKDMEKGSIIVEMTPHYRSRYHASTWKKDELDKILGSQVKVVGQLLLDNDHMDKSSVCSATDATDKCWRLSPWELHPVTEFYYCPGNKCSASSATGWKPLGGK